MSNPAEEIAKNLIQHAPATIDKQTLRWYLLQAASQGYQEGRAE